MSTYLLTTTTGHFVQEFAAGTPGEAFALGHAVATAVGVPLQLHVPSAGTAIVCDGSAEAERRRDLHDRFVADLHAAAAHEPDAVRRLTDQHHCRICGLAYAEHDGRELHRFVEAR